MPRLRTPAILILSSLILSVPIRAQQYVITTFAGGAPPPTSQPAVNVPLRSPNAVAVDNVGNVYFGSMFENVVFKVNSDGILTRIAGKSAAFGPATAGMATSASLHHPAGIAVDTARNVYIA